MTTTRRLHRPEHVFQTTAMIGALLATMLFASIADAQVGGRGGRGGIGRGGIGRGGMGPGRGDAIGRGMHHPMPMIAFRVARLAKQLTLTEDQALEVKDVFAAEHAQLVKLRPDVRPTARPDSATIAARRADLKAIHTLTVEQIDAVLTTEQQAQFAKIREARKLLGIGRGGRGRGGPPGHRPPPPPTLSPPPAA